MLGGGAMRYAINVLALLGVLAAPQPADALQSLYGLILIKVLEASGKAHPNDAALHLGTQ